MGESFLTGFTGLSGLDNVANVKVLSIANTNTQLGTGNIGTGNIPTMATLKPLRSLRPLRLNPFASIPCVCGCLGIPSGLRPTALAPSLRSLSVFRGLILVQRDGFATGS